MARRGIVGVLALLVVVVVVVVLGAAPAWACGGLVGPGGTVQLARTTTLAAYHQGVEHYLTSFTYSGGGAKFGSIVPLPGVPSEVRKGGEWTLQRLIRETQPQLEAVTAPVALAADARSGAEVLLKTRVDALDITILRGGGKAVGDWARQRGFGLSVDAPEVLDFYAARSPIFMAASFDARAASARGQRLGDGTPIQLTIPTADAWVPLRILGLGHRPADAIQADLYLLTDRRPALLPAPAAAGRAGVALERSQPASEQLLADLRADKGMGWVPASGMWLSYLRIDTTAGRLFHDLAVDTSGRGRPSPVAAGLVDPGPIHRGTPSGFPGPLRPVQSAPPLAGGPAAWWPWQAAALAGATVAAALALRARARNRAS
jgi:flagellin-like protein